MSLTWLLLIVVAALIVAGATRFDVLAARWRELFGRPPTMPDAPPASPTPHGLGLRPHDAPVQRPGFHRSGRRH